MRQPGDASEATDSRPAGEAGRTLGFGPFRIDLDARTLHRDASRIEIQRKPLEVLIYLAEAAPRLVTRQELLERFWSRAVNDEALTRCVSTIRKLLGDEAQPPVYIETYRARGYRFTATVTASGQPHAAGAGLSSPATRNAIIVLAIALTAFLALSFSGFFGSDEPDGRIDRLAVLPIVVPPDSDPWLGEALTEDLMQAVATIEGVTVVSSRGLSSDVAPREAGQRLAVEALLLARLYRVDNGSRLRAQLLDTADSSLLWSATVESGDPLLGPAQIEQLSRALAQRLRPMLQLSPPTRQVDPVAYRRYLEGRYHLAQRSAAGLEAAGAAFDAALARQPDYAAALAGAAMSWLLKPLYGAAPPRDAVPRARAYAERALAIEPGNSYARAVLGVIAMQYDWDWQRAEALLGEAVTLNPNNATAQQWLGELYCYREQESRCRERLAVALDLDPLSPVLHMQQASVYLYAGKYARAVELYRAAIASHPEYALARYALGLAHAGLGDWEAAVGAYESALPSLGLAIVGGPLVYALASAGDTGRARTVLTRMESLAANRFVPPSKFAVAWLGLGDRTRALEWFEAALEVRDDRLVYFAVDVHTRELLDDPAFAGLARRIGFDVGPAR